MMASNEEVQIEELLREQAVQHYDILANAQITNMKAARVAINAMQQLRPLKDSLTQMNEYSIDFPKIGAKWQQEKQIVYKSISHQHRLNALLDMPKLVGECIQHEMYHEALLVLDYVYALLKFGEQASLLQFLYTLVYSTMQHDLGSTLLARLGETSRVDAVYKIVLFLRRLGVARPLLIDLFLTQRAKHIQSMMNDSIDNPVAYSRILQLLTIYKTNIHDTVLHFDTCFTGVKSSTQNKAEQNLLTVWCCEQAAIVTGLLIDSISEIKSCAELALVIEQIYICSLSCGKINIDMTTLLDEAITNQVKNLFSVHMRNASSVYRSCMHNHTWRSNAITLRREDDNSRASSSLKDSVVGSDGTNSVKNIGEPPLVLTKWLPLAHAVNGLLTSFNSVRRSVLPGVEVHIALEVANFISMMALDIQSDAHLLAAMDSDEKNMYVTFMKCFIQHFYPYVMQCVDALLGENVHSVIHIKVQNQLTAIELLCNT